MVKQKEDGTIKISMLIKEFGNDFIDTLTDKEKAFLHEMLEGTMDMIIQTILRDRKRKELCNELER